MLRTIEIDWEIHKLIEAERTGFEEPPRFALRRLLGLSSQQPSSLATHSSSDGGAAWVDDGVVVPHGADARMKYLRGKQIYEGKFLNGKLVVNGKSFDKLSPAAVAFAIKKNGSPAESLDGWKYWDVKFPGDKNWQRLWDIRENKRRKMMIELSELDLEF